MDRYTKFILTIIAVALSVIAIRISEPHDANASVFATGPTFGDLRALQDIKDPDERKEAFQRLLRNIPLVWVQGGQVTSL